MKIVDKAQMPPAQCLVSQDIDGPFIDTGTWAHWVDPYVYLSVSWVEEVARKMLNMVPESEIQALREQVASYAAELADLQEYVEASKKLARASRKLAA